MNIISKEGSHKRNSRRKAMVAYRVRLFFFSSRRRHTRFDCDWSSDVCSSDLTQVTTALAEQQPVISVDTKKKELVGDFRNNGREYRPQGNPEEVRVHDFLIKEQIGRASCRKECRSRWSPYH